MPTRTETRTDYHSDNSNGWFVGIIVALALAAIACLVFAPTRPTYDLAVHQPSAHVKLIGNLGTGSGVHIGDGYILTAAHVVVDPYAPGKLLETKIKTDDGREQSSEILWVNKDYDVALLRVSDRSLSAVPLDCAPVVVGDKVHAYGNPMMIEFVYTVGEIVGAERKLDYWLSAVPLSMSVVPGQSGGGILNADGEVVGITVGTLVSPVGAVGLGMMVPSSTICMLMGRK